MAATAAAAQAEPEALEAPTDRPTDRQTDRPTDRPYLRNVFRAADIVGGSRKNHHATAGDRGELALASAIRPQHLAAMLREHYHVSVSRFS